MGPRKAIFCYHSSSNPSEKTRLWVFHCRHSHCTQKIVCKNVIGLGTRQLTRWMREWTTDSVYEFLRGVTTISKSSNTFPSSDILCTVNSSLLLKPLRMSVTQKANTRNMAQQPLCLLAVVLYNLYVGIFSSHTRIVPFPLHSIAVV